MERVTLFKDIKDFIQRHKESGTLISVSQLNIDGIATAIYEGVDMLFTERAANKAGRRFVLVSVRDDFTKKFHQIVFIIGKEEWEEIKKIR